MTAPKSTENAAPTAVCTPALKVYKTRGVSQIIYRPLGYERVYLPLCEVADTPFYIQGDDMLLYVYGVSDSTHCLNILQFIVLSLICIGKVKTDVNFPVKIREGKDKTK